MGERGDTPVEAAIITVWRDAESMAQATGIDEQDRFLGHRLRLPLEIVRAVHYEIVGRTFAALPPETSAYLRIVTVRARPNEEARLLQTLRDRQPGLVAMGLVASHLGRRVVDGACEAVTVGVWPDRATIRAATGGGPERPLFEQELSAWADTLRLETYDGIEIAPRLPIAIGPPIFIVDDDMRIVDVTASAAAALGWEAVELVGRSLRETLDHWSPRSSSDNARRCGSTARSRARSPGTCPMPARSSCATWPARTSRSPGATRSSSTAGMSRCPPTPTWMPRSTRRSPTESAAPAAERGLGLTTVLFRPITRPLHWPTMSVPPPTVWVIVPTYNEADNIRPITAGILAAMPAATVLVVDDGSPDGTGRIADELAAADPRVRVRHRTAKQGLGRAYLDGFGVALDGGATIVAQMDADFSHDPAVLPALVAPIEADEADLVIGSRYTAGGGVVNWGFGRRMLSRGGSLFARTVLRLRSNDLTGGFKAWRASTLGAVPFDGVHAGGYVFQIEMTYRASRAGARVREVPITFRDRTVGQSKMSRRIIVEALVVVVQLRADELIGKVRRRRQPE